MSVPARSGSQMSAMAEVRVNRGSTWMIVAPRLARLHHPLEADRMVLRHRRAHDEDGVGVRRSCWRWWRRRARTRCPDRAPWSYVISGPDC